ncbi:hypothetical protein JTT01_19355 [Clostridium botulinum]|nr:hypothetical protein [Clostridium botulinum]MCS4465190.1 hypothetical protein [Clostridium botulinum]MCS4465968.1 hypothetical protein [Clostridium botulinum]MCS4467769.1 hypothetical protein [Clostridium botulinum]MCS4517131.1 hypothetical protein [Clostridium botulinum]
MATYEAIMDGRLKTGSKTLMSGVGVGINIATIAVIL